MQITDDDYTLSNELLNLTINYDTTFFAYKQIAKPLQFSILILDFKNHKLLSKS